MRGPGLAPRWSAAQPRRASVSLPPRGAAGPPCQGPGQHSPPPRLMSRHPDLRGPSDSASRGKAPEWEGGGSSAGQRTALGRKERERQRGRKSCCEKPRATPRAGHGVRQKRGRVSAGWPRPTAPASWALLAGQLQSGCWAAGSQVRTGCSLSWAPGERFAKFRGCQGFGPPWSYCPHLLLVWAPCHLSDKSQDGKGGWE